MFHQERDYDLHQTDLDKRLPVHIYHVASLSGVTSFGIMLLLLDRYTDRNRNVWKRIRATPCFLNFLLVDFNLGKSTLNSEQSTLNFEKSILNLEKIDLNLGKIDFKLGKIDFKLGKIDLNLGKSTLNSEQSTLNSEKSTLNSGKSNLK